MTSSRPPRQHQIGIMALALTFMGSACTTSKAIDTKIKINASPCTVFDVLADFERYPEWNPYHIRVVGEPEVGAPLEIRVSRPDGKVVDVPHVRVLEVKSCRTLVWGGGLRGVFRGEHRFDLEPVSENVTVLSHTERFDGVFIGFADLPVDVLTQGYEQMNTALKAEIETGAAAARTRQ